LPLYGVEEVMWGNKERNLEWGLLGCTGLFEGVVEFLGLLELEEPLLLVCEEVLGCLGLSEFEQLSEFLEL
jgi:hypothetical protein